MSKVNLTVLAGLLFLCSALVIIAGGIDGRMAAVAMLAMSVLNVVVGLIDKRFIYIVTLIPGSAAAVLMFSALVKLFLDGESLISWSMNFFVFLVLAGGICSGICAIKGLKKAKKPGVEFDFEKEEPRSQR